MLYQVRHLAIGITAAGALLFPSLSAAATFTVSKDGRGAFTTVQAAVDKAGKNDIVEILDQAVYAEQVTIDSLRNGLTIRSANPDAVKKPTITYKDVIHQNPKTCQDALSPNKIDFDQNGALRILWAHNITIDGIAVDGGGAAPFNNPNIWGDGVTCNGQLYPLFHGNAAIALYISGGVTIRRCDITNGYFGISVKDRNQGGAFANFNPADLEKNNIVPLSGFGRVGGHVFEKNRIHHNTWGFFFESAWDLGSTIRYNLLYENHHATAAAAAAVKALSSEGANQPGGAFMFKDVMLTPMAIYNNTFWHNFTLFCGGYRPGAQHLIFNNIFAAPNELWGANLAFGNSFMEMSPFFVNRMHHSLFAAQTQAPQLDSQKINFQEFDQGAQKSVTKDTVVKFYRSVRIMNNMGNVAQENITVEATLELSSGPVTKTQPITGVNLPGGLIGSGTDPFAASANVRWYEIKFKSTDPSSPDFLSPDWDDPVVKKYVMNGGWPAAGIYNSDGQVADLGAVSSVARHTADVVIRPLAPALLNGSTAILNFDLQSVAGELTGAKVKYIRLVKSIPVLLDGFGGTTKLVVPAPVTVTVSDPNLKMGSNTLSVSGVPAFAATETYAFFEIVVEGTAANGKLATTNVGFIPYRKLDYRFLVEVLTLTGQKATSVKVGETVGLRITPQSISGAAFNNPITPVEARLTSGSDLFAPGTPPAKLALDQVEGIKTVQVMFTKVPAGGGLEYVAVSGIWKSGANTLAFYGISDGVKILPGDPAKLVFQDPPSKILTPGAAPVVDPGTQYTVKVQVRDRFDNPVGLTATVAIKSNNPTIGDIVDPTPAKTDSLGIATFKAQVTNGDLNDLFELEASITGVPVDKADLKVGKARDRLWILYGDTQKYNEAAELRGNAGERLKVTIRAGKNPDSTLTERQTQIKVTGTQDIAIYPTQGAADTASVYALVNGEITVWVTGLRAVDNGSLYAEPTTDNTIMNGSRGKVFFTFVPSSVLSSSFHADNGVAAVDRVVIIFKMDLKRAPDSIALAWPASGQNAKMIKTGIAWDAAAPSRVTVKLAEPFPAGISSGLGSGTAYTYDPSTPAVGVQSMVFANGADSVGSLLDTAAVLEKLDAGGDTLFLSINEKFEGSRLVGASLLLIKPGAAPIALNVLGAVEVPGRGWRVAINDMGLQAPAAGDSLKLNPAGPFTDLVGNRPHALNRPVVLKLKYKPKPAVLSVNMDKPYLIVRNEPQAPDFVVLTGGNADSTWTPVLGSLAGTPARDCRGMACGGPLVSAPEGGLDRPSFTLETDRGMKFSVSIFNNVGEFVNGFNGEITNAQLGLDERNFPIPGATPLFLRNAKGRYVVKIAWSAKAKSGSRAATGAYIAKLSANSKVEDDAGRLQVMKQSPAVRFGLVRK